MNKKLNGVQIVCISEELSIQVSQVVEIQKIRQEKIEVYMKQLYKDDWEGVCKGWTMTDII